MNDDVVIPRTPADVVQFVGDDFLFAAQLGNAAWSFRMPMDSPAKFGFTIGREDGSSERFQLADNPLNRFGLAVREHFSGDPAKTMSFLMRWFALMRIIRLEECQKYIRPEPDDSSRLIHSSVFDVAATQPLNQEWEFDSGEFFDRVAELYAKDPN